MLPKASWIEEHTIEDTLEIYQRLALAHLDGVQGPTAGIIRDLIQRKLWSDLLNVELDYSKADGDGSFTTHALIQIRQALGFFQKLKNLDVGVDKTAKARVKFYESEERCRKTNELFAAYLRRGLSLTPALEALILRARGKIGRLLGSAPRISELRMRHGPGASTNVKREDAAAVNKFAAGIECSQNLSDSGLLPVILRAIPHWTACHTSDVYIDEDGWLCESVNVSISTAKLGFVPKNAQIYRTTVTECPLNMFVQLGVGDFMGDCLKRVGVDIKDQKPNQRLAKLGSLTGGVSTLDLASASDTIARQLVRALLPEDWFYLLDTIRSSTIYDRWAPKGSRFVHLQKFSSMGNGFTFPLETLIFWALTTSVCTDPTRVSIYGDDITCAREDTRAVITALESCGFEVNTKKSFSSGPFRESCGADYYFGIDIRPYYAKSNASAASLFTLHNRYVRFLEHDKAAIVREYIHPDLQIWGPAGAPNKSYGDGHLHFLPGMDRPPLTHSFRERGWAGYSFDTFVRGPVRRKTRFPGDWVTPLYTQYVKGEHIDDSISTGDDDLHGDSPRLEHTPPDLGQRVALSLKDQRAVQFSSTKKDGRPTWTFPGSEGYSKVSIYTLG